MSATRPADKVQETERRDFKTHTNTPDEAEEDELGQMLVQLVLTPHTAMQTCAQPTRRTYSNGPHLPDVDGQQIEAEAKAAAQAGHSLNRACPYPFRHEAGQHFVAVYYLNRHAHPSTANVLARSAHALEIAQP